jgi:hypothetical protein
MLRNRWVLGCNSNCKSDVEVLAQQKAAHGERRIRSTFHGFALDYPLTSTFVPLPGVEAFFSDASVAALSLASSLLPFDFVEWTAAACDVPTLDTALMAFLGYKSSPWSSLHRMMHDVA